MKKQLLNALLFSIIPGLLPFSSEPHIVGKVKWILGGAVGMQPMDYFDTLLHGSPFIYLIIVLIKWGKAGFQLND